jgi:hypothetical protein
VSAATGARPALQEAHVSAPTPVSDGKTLGIVGLVLAFVFSLAGLIVSLIARNQSKAAGVTNTPAKVGVVLSIIFLVISVLSWIGFIASGALSYALNPMG